MKRIILTISEILGIGSFILALGICIGEAHRGKGPFFVSWLGNDLYYGEQVKLKDSAEQAMYYNLNCNKMTIQGLEYSEKDPKAWVRLDDCGEYFASYRFQTFYQSDLEKDNRRN